MDVLFSFACAWLESEDHSSLVSMWCYIAKWFGRHSLACTWCLLIVCLRQASWLLLCMMSKSFWLPICCEDDYAWTHTYSRPLSLYSHPPAHTQMQTHKCKHTDANTQMQADVIIYCNRGVWLEELSLSSGSIPQKLRRDYWGRTLLELMRKTQAHNRGGKHLQLNDRHTVTNTTVLTVYMFVQTLPVQIDG